VIAGQPHARARARGPFSTAAKGEVSRFGTRSDAAFQASKLLDYVRRGGDPARWMESKDFTPSEARAVQSALRRLRRGK
jgi:GH25 family lysozyme M1 (1,4-beta-N-acetylmuramidase)